MCKLPAVYVTHTLLRIIRGRGVYVKHGAWYRIYWYYEDYVALPSRHVWSGPECRDCRDHHHDCVLKQTRPLQVRQESEVEREASRRSPSHLLSSFCLTLLSLYCATGWIITLVLFADSTVRGPGPGSHLCHFLEVSFWHLLNKHSEFVTEFSRL